MVDRPNGQPKWRQHTRKDLPQSPGDSQPARHAPTVAQWLSHCIPHTRCPLLDHMGTPATRKWREGDWGRGGGQKRLNGEGAGRSMPAFGTGEGAQDDLGYFSSLQKGLARGVVWSGPGNGVSPERRDCLQPFLGSLPLFPPKLAPAPKD